MLFDTPDWARRHNFFHHSNPRSKDRAKAIFEKTHVRPKVKLAKSVLRQTAATPEEIAEAEEILATYDTNRSSANMAAGIAVQDACNLHLIPADDYRQSLSVTEAQFVARKTLQKYQPKNFCDAVLQDDSERKEQYLTEIEAVTAHAIMGLKEAMRHDNLIIGETEYLKVLKDCVLPYNTLPDYGRRGDLKTKWSRPAKKKDGTRTWHTQSLPSSLSGEYDMNNVFQVAGFWACNNGLPPFLVYANKTDYKVFTKHNAPELTLQSLKDHVREICIQSKTTESLLRAAEDKQALLSLCAPDWKSITWKEPPAYIEAAKKMWGY